MKSLLRFAIASCAVAVLAGACEGGGGATSPGSQCLADEQMMKSLAPTCQGCHNQGPFGFFASVSAFEGLLVGDKKYVVPGHPEQSYLIQLLDGKGSGTYRQMPLSGDAFSKLATDGKTQVTLKDVSDWIAKMSPRPVDTTPSPDAPTVNRLSAEQVEATLYVELGLTPDDFFTLNQAAVYGTPAMVSKGEDNYPIYSYDGAPGAFEIEPTIRHATLGGRQTLLNLKKDWSPAVTFAEALVPVSQRWCKMAVAKPNNSLLFPKVAPSAKSATSADAIKANIGYLALHFLGDVPDQNLVDDVFQNVFVPIEAESDPPTAWAGVCSYFIRHPKWIFY